ncbi:arabinan endo-1,5-alpha-L-arabinosidase [Chitinophaga sp. CF118]|uniref:arabinan endo-1,5-alpha-L-arabinosidase n=1 Tax=Chitinophaga sp. CF118 TaxID=1884367 RepID=UPI0008DEB1CC|nr:arabinan endo-1,5-alpha-L-arabinosidase [Chitinophaga sp. CF118]SFD87660.1 arabinan endo-1,5-alpha-L-arabinosidase [Chitinophaga sp. CF118]
MKLKAVILLCIFPLVLQAQPVPAGTVFLTRNTPVHDPVIIKEKDTYYVFCTGFGITVFSSRDLQHWRKEKSVFVQPPEWAMKAVPGFKGHIWAPDISFHNGRYYLYYAVSAFGKNTSCIGVAVNTTLDNTSPDYKWEDKGKVIQSVPGRDMWNAIDPNLIVDSSKTPWLAFGSFWDGIKLVKLADDLLSVATPEEWYSIAKRPRDITIPDTVAGDGAVEAPFIFQKGKYYYLFVSWDYCCRGEKSNYKVVVGRSEKVQGPYLDKQNIPMELNGGTIVVQGKSTEWYGVGHNAVYTAEGKDYFIYHGYDAHDQGRSKLLLEEIKWDKDCWPIILPQND